MSRDVETIGRNDELAIAESLMAGKRMRHLVVLNSSGTVCGVLSQRDIFRGALLRSLGYGSRVEDRLLKQLVVKEAMSTELVTTTSAAPIRDAAQTMIDGKIGCLPVVDDDKLVGIITESDFVSLCTSSTAAP